MSNKKLKLDHLTLFLLAMVDFLW